MIGYMSLEEQVDVDFSRARRRATLRRLAARLRRDATYPYLNPRRRRPSLDRIFTPVFHGPSCRATPKG
jgi:hypothetical protein